MVTSPWDGAQRTLRALFERDSSLRDRLARQLRHRRLMICFSHADHHLHLGGVQLYMRVEQRGLDARGVSYVTLWQDEKGEIGVSCDGAVLGHYGFSEVEATFAALSTDGLSVAAVTIHHLKDWTLERVIPLLSTIAPPVTRFFLHDYYSICANPTLTFGDVLYCDAPPPDSQACTICRHGVARRAQQSAKKRLMEQLAARGTEFIAPSEVAGEIWLRHYPEHRSRLRVVPHQALAPTGRTLAARSGIPRVGFVGFGAASKGAREWIELMKAPTLSRNFDFYHFGLCAVGCRAQHVKADFIKDGFDAMSRALTRYRLDFAFLWSIWPETFSFTCFEALASGCFVLTNHQSGNIAAQIQRTGRGRVFSDIAEVRRFLLDPAAVAAARRSLTGSDVMTPVWSDTLLSELA